jgi:hypothetical protein
VRSNSAMHRRRRWLVLAGGALGLLPAIGFADGGDPLTDRFSLSLGAFLLDTSTEIRVDGTAERTGTELDLERDLGLGDTDRFRFDGYWRFMPKHKVRLMYFGTRHSRTRVLDREISIGDSTFPINVQVDSSFDTDVIELAYEYAFLQRENYEITGTFGIHALMFDLSIQGSQGSAVAGLSESAKSEGPLPVLGARGIWKLNEKFYVDAHAQYFKIELDPYDGRLEDYNASIVWQAFRSVGFGVGYNAFVTRLDVDGDRFDGRLRWKYDGARVFVTASF